MKNKKMVYVLGFAVLFLWGFIIYRIFNAAGGNDDNVVQITADRQPKEPFRDYTLQKDTTRLLLNYRDPFAITKQKDTAEIPVSLLVKKHKVITPVKVQIIWPEIQYSGFVRNPESKKLFALMRINGKNQILSEGETREKVTLLRNLKDSIKIAYQGQSRIFTLKHAL